MKVSLDWLEQYTPGIKQIGAQRAADALMEGGLPVESIETHGLDTVLDVEVTSNRSDCLSHVGVARELAALLNLKFAAPAITLKEAAQQAQSVTSVQINHPALCPYYSARVIRNVKVGPSPEWMVKRLEAIGLRSINNVVDVTNYVMMELGQPLHAFDFDKLAGNKIVVRRALKGEKLVSIDAKTRELSPDMLVIADAQNPVAIAGVMGGKESEVHQGTVNVLLESARFDPLSVRKTSRGLALRSDSSYRFERGIDPTASQRASQRAAQLIIETAGGELLGGFAAAGDASWQGRPLALRLEKIRQVLGIDIPADEALTVLARLGFAPKLTASAIECTVPSHRLDVSIEVDLVEEVARTIGYARIPTREQIEIRLNPPQAQWQVLNEIRSVLVAAGYHEALTFSWVSDAMRDEFRPDAAKALLRADEMVRKDNAFLRTSMLPGLLEAVRRNETVGNPPTRLFEMGQTFWAGADGKIDERRRLSIVGLDDYREVRGAVEAVLKMLDPRREVTVVAGRSPGFADAACGIVQWDGVAVGVIGKIDRAVAQKLDLRDVPVAAELELAPLMAGQAPVTPVKDLAKFPAIKRDLSLVVEEKIRYAQIQGLVAGLGLASLEDVEYVTTYRGKQAGEGKKSVTLQLVFRSADKTLTSDEVEESVQKVVAAAKQELAAELRV